MDIRPFVDRFEAVQRELDAMIASRPQAGLKLDLTEGLRQIEAARIADGEDGQAARSASWKRAKVLHGLGYPVDFGWLHTPVEEAA